MPASPPIDPPEDTELYPAPDASRPVLPGPWHPLWTLDNCAWEPPSSLSGPVPTLPVSGLDLGAASDAISLALYNGTISLRLAVALSSLIRLRQDREQLKGAPRDMLLVLTRELCEESL